MSKFEGCYCLTLMAGLVNTTFAEGSLHVKKCQGVIEGEGRGVVSKCGHEAAGGTPAYQ